MKKGILSVYCLAFLLLPVTGFTQDISIAAAGIEPIGVQEETARLTDELITTALTGNPMFTLIERRQIEALIEEQKLQQSGITDTSSAVEAGAILNADKILFGSIGKYDSKYVEFILSLRLIDVERAEVELAESIQVRSMAELPAKVEEIIDRITSGISVTGKVVGTEEDSVYISLGARSGTAVGDILGVYKTEIIRDDAGTILMREDIPAANLRAERVQEDRTRCSILESAEPVEPGLFVRPGRADLGDGDEYGAIAVESKPEGAMVFLDDDFLGETPLTVDSIPPGKYHLEIRAGGYTPYHGQINLHPGRTVSLNRELDRELEVEDLILLGKIPRRSTDPSTALRKALIPGQGLVYNGYKNLGLVMPVQMFTMASLAAYLAVADPPVEGAEPSTGAGYWDIREYYRDIETRGANLAKAAVLAGYALGVYGFSIIDSALSAGDDFLYPVYLEVSFGGSGNYSRLVQTADTYSSTEFNAVITSGMEGLSAGGFMDLAFMGRKYYFLFGLDYLLQAIIIRLEGALRFVLSDSLYLGVGAFLTENTMEPSEVEFTAGTGAEDFDPSPGGYGGPLIQLSYRPSAFCLDMWFSPWTIGRVHNYTLPGSNTWTDLDSISGISGISGGVRVEHYFSLSTGIRVSADVFSLFNNTSVLPDHGITSADADLQVNIKLGMVYRF